MFDVHLGLLEGTAMLASCNDNIVVIHLKSMCCFVCHHIT